MRACERHIYKISGYLYALLKKESTTKEEERKCNERREQVMFKIPRNYHQRENALKKYPAPHCSLLVAPCSPPPALDFSFFEYPIGP
jgi:hypothetical protein